MGSTPFNHTRRLLTVSNDWELDAWIDNLDNDDIDYFYNLMVNGQMSDIMDAFRYDMEHDDYREYNDYDRYLDDYEAYGEYDAYYSDYYDLESDKYGDQYSHDYYEVDQVGQSSPAPECFCEIGM